jgi:hypothetical protein
MDEDQLNRLVDMIVGKVGDKLQERQKEQMNKVQEELTKLKEALSKKEEGEASVIKVNEGEGGGEKTPKGGSKIPFDYSQLSKSSSAHLPNINPGKPPQFDGIRYTDWAHRMKMHLIAARCWEPVEIGIRMLEEDEEVTLEHIHDVHLNATAASIILSTLPTEDYNKVNGRESAKEIWDILKLSYKGDKCKKRKH